MSTSLPHGWPDGLPDPDLHDLDTAGWWGQCAERRLCLQRCRECGAQRFPPRPVCHRCLSLTWSWEQVGPGGEIYSACEPHYAAHPSLRSRVPYLVVLVVPDGSEGERVVGNLLEPATPRLDVLALIGRRVVCEWEPVGERYVLPQWRLAAPPAGPAPPPALDTPVPPRKGTEP